MCGTGNSDWSSKNSYKIAFDSMNREITLFWTRSSYFLLANTVILSGLLLTMNKPGPNYLVCFSLSFFGLIASVSWFLVNVGSKCWILRWELELGKIESQMLECKSRLYGISVKQQMEKVEVYLDDGKKKREESVGESRSGKKLVKIVWARCQDGIDWFTKRKPSVTGIAIFLSLLFLIIWLVAMGVVVRSWVN